MEGLERCARSGKATPFWDRWGAAWKVRGCPQDTTSRCCEGRGGPLPDPERLGTAGFRKARFPGRPTEGGSARAPPRRDTGGAPSATPGSPPGQTEGRAGPPRCAGGWAESGRCAAQLRAGPSPRPPPRVKAKVSAVRRSARGRGRRGPGSGRRALEGPWMGSAAASEPA